MNKLYTRAFFAQWGAVWAAAATLIVAVELLIVYVHPVLMPTPLEALCYSLLLWVVLCCTVGLVYVIPTCRKKRNFTMESDYEDYLLDLIKIGLLDIKHWNPFGIVYYVVLYLMRGIRFILTCLCDVAGELLGHRLQPHELPHESMEK